MWRRVYGSGYTLRPDVSLVGVLSGIEMACWDIVGKEVNKPVYELLGGQVHEKLRLHLPLPEGGRQRPRSTRIPTLAAERAAEYRRLKASPRSNSTPRALQRL